MCIISAPDRKKKYCCMLILNYCGLVKRNSENFSSEIAPEAVMNP